MLTEYGVGRLFKLPAVTQDDTPFLTSPTIAAGDGKFAALTSGNFGLFANFAADVVAFTSLSELPSVGDTIVGATSGTSSTYIGAVVNSGTVAGGDAAGFMFLDTPDGAYQSENLNISGGTANFATIGGDTTAGGFGHDANGNFVVALTDSELQCEEGHILLRDAAGDEWQDTELLIETEGNASAKYPESQTARANFETVFNTDFATNYNATRNAWATNVQDLVGTSAVTIPGLKFPTGLYFDGTGGTSGTTYPTGERIQPALNAANLLTIANANNVKQITMLTNLTLTAADWGGFTFISPNRNQRVLACGSATGLHQTTIIGASVTGAFPAGEQEVLLQDCLLSSGITNLQGLVVNSTLSQSSIPIADGPMEFINCRTLGNSSVTIDCNSGVSVELSVRGYEGPLTIDSLVGGATCCLQITGDVTISNTTGGTVNIELIAGSVTLAGTVTGGTFVISGTGELSDSSSGTTVTDNLTSTQLATIDTNVDTLLTRIPAALFNGITSLAQWLGAAFGKQTANATALTEINATGAGSGTFAGGSEDSLEGIRDRGDAAWITATGFSTHSAADAAAATEAAILNEGDATALLAAIAAKVEEFLINEGDATATIAAIAAACNAAVEAGQVGTDTGGLVTELAKVPKSDSNVSWNATAAAQIQSKSNDAMVALHLDHLLAATYDPASKPGVSDALLNELVENDGGVSRFTANTLEQGPGGSAPTVQQIVDGVLDEPNADHLDAGSIGKAISDAQSAGDPWAGSLPGSYNAGEAGYILGNLVATLTASGVTIESPVTSDGELQLVSGDGYYNADSRALSFTYTGKPSFTGGTPTLILTVGGTSLSKTGTVVSSTQIRFDLTEAETAMFTAPGKGIFATRIALVTSGNVVTLEIGTLIIKKPD